MLRRSLVLAVVLSLAGCNQTGRSELPGDASDHHPYAGVEPDETIRFTGTEPFWNGEASATHLTYKTPDNGEGVSVAVKRFAGRGGFSLGGGLDGKSFDMMITPGNCSDGMSDRTYPFVVVLKIGDELRSGCGWTDKRGFRERLSPEPAGMQQ